MTVSTRKLYSLAAVAVVVLAAAWYLAIYRPSSAKIASAHKSYASAASQVSKLDSQVASLQALEAHIPADKAQLASLDQAVPTTENLRGLLDQLHALATSTGTELTTVTPSPPQSATGTQSSSAPATSTTGLQEIPVTMAASGTYGQLTSFMSGLTNLQRSMVIQGVSISSGTNGQLTASLSTQVFYAP